MKTENEYRRLAALAAEVEGLLMVMESRREGDTSLILELLAEKATLLEAGIMALPYPTREEATEEPSEKSEKSEMSEKSDVSDVSDLSDLSDSSDSSVPSDNPAPSDSTPASAAPSAPATLDERLARERARDINKAFTLNDKFRFRRDLFRGSETDFDETMQVISAMSDFSEAEEYFYDDLCWDPEDPAVKEFMEIVSRHF